MANINNSGNKRCWQGCGERGTFLVGMQTGAATLENSVEVPQKLKLPDDPAITLLGIYPWDTGVLFQRGTCTLMFIVVLSTIAKA